MTKLIVAFRKFAYGAKNRQHNIPWIKLEQAIPTPLLLQNVRICIELPNNLPHFITTTAFPLYFCMQIHGLCYSLIVDLTPH